VVRNQDVKNRKQKAESEKGNSVDSNQWWGAHAARVFHPAARRMVWCFSRFRRNKVWQMPLPGSKSEFFATLRAWC